MSLVLDAITTICLSCRWCGGEDCLSFYKFGPEHERPAYASCYSLSSLSERAQKCVESLKLFDDAGELHILNLVSVRCAQEFSLERSVLLAHILWLLARQAPGEEGKRFAQELCRSTSALLEDRISLLSAVDAIWYNLNQLMDFLSPLQVFPKDHPVISAQVFPSLKLLAWDMKVISENLDQTLSFDVVGLDKPACSEFLDISLR